MPSSASFYNKMSFTFRNILIGKKVKDIFLHAVKESNW